MKDIILLALILFLGWRVYHGQRTIMKKSWKRVRYHWGHTLEHLGEWSLLVAVSFLGFVLLAIMIYALFLQDVL